MANRYANLVGSKKISEDWSNINTGFDRVQAEMDTKGTPADAQAKADAAKQAAIDTAAAALTAHKQRGADEHPTAKGNAAGFMSAADKLLVDARTSAATPDTLMQRDAEGRAKVAPPVAADDIARKAETDAVQGNLDSHAADADIHVTADDHEKLDGIAAGAEVNQNAFVKVNDVVANDPSDTITFVEGTGIRVTTDPENKRISITATGEAIPGPHALSHIQGGADVIPDAVTGGLSGLMSGADAKFVRQDGETKTGAQAKADAAKQAANEYTDQKFGEISIDDASLTNKGIVQLSNKTDGDAETVAATEKAVNDARVSALSASKTYVDEKGWQKYALTQSDGVAKQLPQSYNINNLLQAGVYGVLDPTNAPFANRYYLIEVTVYSDGTATFVMQKAVIVGGASQSYYQRSRSNAGTWSAWSVDLFTSVSDGKNAIAAAITGKGVAASGSDTFPQLATKIGQISTGPKYAKGSARSNSLSTSAVSWTGSVVGNVYQFYVGGLGFRPNRIIIRYDPSINPTDIEKAVNYVYDASTRNAVPADAFSSNYNHFTFANAYNYQSEVFRVYEITGNSQGISWITNDSFSVPVRVPSQLFSWEAFRV